MIGIYKIRCKNNNECYIGSSVNIKMRWYFHLCQLRHGKHHSRLLQESYDKYGESSLELSVIKQLDSAIKKDLYELEFHYIEQLKPKFNIVSPKYCNLGNDWNKKISKTITKLFEDKNNHPRFHKGKLYDVYNILGDKIFHNMSIIEIAEKLNIKSYHTLNNIMKKYDGITCTNDNEYVIIETSKTINDVIVAYKTKRFNERGRICNLSGEKFKRGNNYAFKGRSHKGEGVTFLKIHSMIMKTDDLYVSVRGVIYTLPFLCRFVQQCISNNTRISSEAKQDINPACQLEEA